MTRQTLRECPDCGQIVRLHRLPAEVDARCPRCDAVIQRNRHIPLTAPLAFALAGMVMLLVTVSLPFLELRLLGRTRQGWVESGAISFFDQGLWLLSIVVIATVVLAPLLKLALLLSVMLGLRLERPPRWLLTAFRWHHVLAPWAMLEVFLFGALVSYTRLVDLAEVVLQPAAWSLGCVVLLFVATDAALDPEAVWEALDRGEGDPASGRPVAQPGVRPIGCHTCNLLTDCPPLDRCPRCEGVLHARKPDSVARTWALIAAAAALYVPANYFAVMNIVTFGKGGPHTILGGVVEFVETGFWPLALIVFLASVAVPMLKLIGLLLMLLGIHNRSARHLRERTRLYRFIEAIGRWSMIDIFVVSVLVSLVSFGPLASIRGEIGAVCFAGVVVLTILAAESFDPRLMWDAAERRR